MIIDMNYYYYYYHYVFAMTHEVQSSYYCIFWSDRYNVQYNLDHSLPIEASDFYFLSSKYIITPLLLYGYCELSSKNSKMVIYQYLVTFYGPNYSITNMHLLIELK